MNATTDWRTLPAGRELDRLIAERAGFHVEDATLYAPSGTLMGGDYRIHAGLAPETPESIDQCWESYAPRFSTSVDAALMLLATVSCHVEITIYPDGSIGVIGVYPVRLSPESATLHGGDLALTLCRIWLEWMETKGVNDVDR